MSEVLSIRDLCNNIELYVIYMYYLKFEQKFSVLGLHDTNFLFQKPLFVLITFQFLDIFHRGLEDRPFVLPHIPHNVVIPKGICMYSFLFCSTHMSFLFNLAKLPFFLYQILLNFRPILCDLRIYYVEYNLGNNNITQV